LQNPEAQNFLIWRNNFLKQNRQHRDMQNRGFCKSGNKKQQDIPKERHNGIDEMDFV